MALYQQEFKLAFTMFPLWTILRNAKKWQDAVVDKERRHQKRKADTPPVVDELGGTEVVSNQDAQNSRPPGKKTAKMMAKDGRISASMLESTRKMAESSEEMVKVMKKKTAALS